MTATTERKIACDECGATVEYRPDVGVAELTCPSCGHRQAIAPAVAAATDDYAALLAASIAAGAYADSAVLTCDTCGAATTVPATVLAERCPFCAAPTVSSGKERVVRPSAVLPFALDEQAARDAVVAWERGLWFKPGRFAPAGGAWQLSAVYLPYWTFDWDVTTDYEGARGHTHDNKTTWTPATGSVRTRLEGSTVFGSRGVGRAQGSELEPWDSDKVVGFKDAYLQGVRAETSGLTVARAGDLGHRLLERQVIYDVERDIGGDHQRIERKTLRYDVAKVRLALMPIWVAHYAHGGERYRVLVNARTGEVIGERPVSVAKVVVPALVPLVLALLGSVLVPRLLHWHLREGWRTALASFWLVLGAVGLVGLVVGALMTARAKRREPARHKDLYVARQGPGTSGLQVDLAAMWRGALQADGVSRGTLLQIFGFALLFIALMPAFTTALFTDMLMPVVMMHAFSALAIGAFVWAVKKSGTDRRELLGLDDD